MLVIGYVLIVLGAVATGVWLAARLEHKNKSTRDELVRIVHPPTLEHDLVSAPIRAIETPLLPPQDNAQGRMRERLRERKIVSGDVVIALNVVSVEFGDRVSLDDRIRTALQVGFSPAETAKFMAERKYETSEIGTILVAECKLTVFELGEIIMPLAKDGDKAARAEETFEIVKDAYGLGDDDADLLQLPTHLGCSNEDAAVIIYSKTDMRLGSTLRALKLCAVPDVAADIARKLDVDLSDDDEYETIREDDEVGFDAAATILRACGKDAETVILAENAHDELSDDKLDEVFSSLSAAGFSHTEIIKGVIDSGIISRNSYAAVAQAALERKVPTGTIVAFLKDEGVDIDELDEEMRELEMETPTRIDLLHAYLHVETKTAVQEVVEANKA